MAKITKEDGREGDTRRLQEGEGDRKDREEGGITGRNPREEWRIGENDLEQQLPEPQEGLFLHSCP